MTQDEIKAQKDALLGEIKSTVSTELNTRGFQKKEEVETLVTEKMKAFEGMDLDGLRSITDKESGVMAIIKKQGEAIAALGETNKGEDLSTRGQITRWQIENKDAIAKIKSGIAAELKPLELRNVTMLKSTNVGAITLPVADVSGFNDLVRKQPSFYDYLPKGRTGLASFPWVNKSSKLGSAAFIGEGVLKPLASFSITTEVSNAKKVAERMKASTELLEDVAGMQTMIEQELEYEVMMAVNTALLTGVASSTSPAGITTISSLYTLTTVKTTAPNNADAIVAATTQLTSLNFSGRIVAFMNPIDYANMAITKAAGIYNIMGANGNNPVGVPIVIDNNIAVGFLLLVDLDKYKVLIYKDFAISWGWENDDFSKNLMTVIGEMRIHQYFSANNTGAFIYDSFANIKTAITAI